MLNIIFQSALYAATDNIPFKPWDLYQPWVILDSFGPSIQNFILYYLIFSFNSNETTIFTYQWYSQFSRQIAFTSPVHTTSHTHCRDFHEPAQIFFRCLFLKGYVSRSTSKLSVSFTVFDQCNYIFYFLFNFDLILLPGWSQICMEWTSSETFNGTTRGTIFWSAYQ